MSTVASAAAGDLALPNGAVRVEFVGSVWLVASPISRKPASNFGKNSSSGFRPRSTIPFVQPFASRCTIPAQDPLGLPCPTSPQSLDNRSHEHSPTRATLLRQRFWPTPLVRRGGYRTRLFATNHTLAGRSASRRMKYGYQASPNGT